MYQGGHGNEVRRLDVLCFNCRTLIPLWWPTGTPFMITSTCSVCKAVNWMGAPAAPHSYYHHPSLLTHQPLHAPHVPKKAVICGIAYKNSGRYKPLKGCINDAKLMRDLLINQFNFPQSSIIMLTEEETDPSRIPTRRNIMGALQWLVEGCQAGDSLFFHYSGHGSWEKNKYDGEEVDGRDETLCPMDSETAGQILDDQINKTIVNPLPPGVKLHAVIDACYSGTALDLPFRCRITNNKNGKHQWEDHRPRSGVWKGTDGGEAILFSGCDDHQTSGESDDTSVTSQEKTSICGGCMCCYPSKDKPITGVMTISFIEAINKLGVGATYWSILTSTRNTIPIITNGGAVKSVLNGGSLGDLVYNTLMRERCSLGDAIESVISMLQNYGSAGSSVGNRLDHNSSRQEPQLTSAHQFNIHQKQFFL